MSVDLGTIRRAAAQLRRHAADRATGRTRRFVRPDGPTAQMPLQQSLRQPIKSTASAEAKRHNLHLAAERLNDRLVAPGAVLALWPLLGRPTAARGFAAGRSLVAGELALDYGGGLCQLAGLVYHLSLRCGLDIVERHPHSADIYTEQTRYTPLGADAAIAWGFKDLRVRNPTPAPLAFRLVLAADHVVCSVHAARPLPRCAVRFERTLDSDTERIVETSRVHPGGAREDLGRSRYRVPA